MFICLVKHGAEPHAERFYALSIQPHLFGGWSLLCEWGRLGEPGRVSIAMYASEAQAQAALAKKLREKQRKGYAAPPGERQGQAEADASARGG